MPARQPKSLDVTTVGRSSVDLCGVQAVAHGGQDHGIPCDRRLGRDALCMAVGIGLWVGPAGELAQGSRRAADQPLAKGFVVGRTIFGDAAPARTTGAMTGADAVAQRAERFGCIGPTWDRARRIQGARSRRGGP